MEKPKARNNFQFSSGDECGASGGEADSDEDVVTEYQITSAIVQKPAEMMRPNGGAGGGGGGGQTTNHGPLPTISVTPHSPANKSYPILEDTLRQIRDLSETVHQMRHQTIRDAKENKEIPRSALNPFIAQIARLSASCPALNEIMSEMTETIGGCGGGGGSLGSSPMHGPSPPSRKNSGAHSDWLCRPETNNHRQRRRSWTALEDLRENCGVALDTKQQRRQRSVSLSSMESEADESLWDNVDGSTVRLLGPEIPNSGQVVTVRRANRASGGAASTHSLNEADLQNDFDKLKAKREAEQLRLLPQRLPLQKSISTPSIIAVGDLAVEPTLVGVQPAIPATRPSCTESETEEESVHLVRSHFNSHIAYPHHVGYDRHAEKRRKRGSLFFRKKKDKSKKMHQWVSACYGSSHICDSCGKMLNNKPALYCECCGTTVHQNSCKDNIGDCTKPKGSKSVGKLGGFGMPLPNSGKILMSKRGSGSLVSNSTARRNQPCYSPWRRVATKLGVNQILMGDDKDSEHHGHHDATSFPDDVPLVPLEFLSDSPLTASDLCHDLSLGLNDTEPESWSPNVGKEITKKLKEKEVKRQEHIYEFVLTEKHHCMTLLVMQKIFVDGLQKHFQLGASLERMFPRLGDLIEIHLGFLSRLRQRQRESPVVPSIADILLDMFSESNAAKLKSAYGEFCSRHRYAVEIYKYYMQNDARFGQFVRHCQQNPLLKKKGIPECILFVTQRLTKYPLLIEPLIKTSKDNKFEQEILQKSLHSVKEILVEVDAQVAEKEKEDRKLEIYNRIDAKSCTVHRGYKFKKSDILQGNRLLRFEGVAMLMQGRGKMQLVLVIVLSDVLFFLQENSNKYTFFTPDNKAGVVSLQKLLVREKAGQDSRGIYLISSNPADPEMFELKVHKPKDKQTWIQAIRKAVQTCPEDDEEFNVSSDEKMIIQHKQNQIKHIVGLLRQKDIEQALLLEEKMSLQLKLMTISGVEPPSPPTYRHLVSENADTEKMWKEVLMAVQEVTHLASSLYATGTNLSRSVSSAGEHQSEAYVSPVLPKRAETFGGFDNNSGGPFRLFKQQQQKCSASNQPINSNELFENLRPNDSKLFTDSLPFRKVSITNGNVEQSVHPTIVQNSSSNETLFTLGREQQFAAIQLSHYVYTLLCIISQLMTTNECLQAESSSCKNSVESKQIYRHNQQLEELRNLQDKLSKEKAEWSARKESETKELEEKRRELEKIQEQIKIEQADIKQQREQLYRKMEILTSQGLLISPNIALPSTNVLQQMVTHTGDETSEENSPMSDSSTTSNSSHSIDRRKDSKWSCNKVQTTTNSSVKSSNLPINLISTTNQYKVQQNTTIKQQLPLKLASRLTNNAGMPQSMSVGNISGNMSGQQQVLPFKLQQTPEEKERRVSSSSGYHRLGGSDSFSPTSGETTPTSGLPPYHAHSRTGSSPAVMPQGGSSSNSNNNSQPQSPPQCGNNRAARTNTYPKFPDKFRVKNSTQQQQSSPKAATQNAEEEVIYF